ncbi:MAG: phosphatase PAP2 family protein [Gammaproteobacteria bacterium]|nr:phosphatase PAP2 family protein [Gammaproteobacteria bacterium]
MTLCCARQVAADDAVETAGDVLMAAIPLAGLGATVVHEEGSEGTVQFFLTLGASELATQGLKEITDKRRPNGNCCESFPSGHSSRAFAGATFIQQRYGWKYALPAYVGAAFVAYSRVEADKHFVEDVIAGAAIGIASGIVFTSPYRGVAVMPYADASSVGVHLAACW